MFHMVLLTGLLENISVVKSSSRVAMTIGICSGCQPQVSPSSPGKVQGPSATQWKQRTLFNTVQMVEKMCTTFTDPLTCLNTGYSLITHCVFLSSPLALYQLQ